MSSVKSFWQDKVNQQQEPVKPMLARSSRPVYVKPPGKVDEPPATTETPKVEKTEPKVETPPTGGAMSMKDRMAMFNAQKQPETTPVTKPSLVRAQTTVVVPTKTLEKEEPKPVVSRFGTPKTDAPKEEPKPVTNRFSIPQKTVEKEEPKPEPKPVVSRFNTPKTEEPVKEEPKVEPKTSVLSRYAPKTEEPKPEPKPVVSKFGAQKPVEEPVKEEPKPISRFGSKTEVKPEEVKEEPKPVTNRFSIPQKTVESPVKEEPKPEPKRFGTPTKTETAPPKTDDAPTHKAPVVVGGGSSIRDRLNAFNTTSTQTPTTTGSTAPIARSSTTVVKPSIWKPAPKEVEAIPPIQKATPPMEKAKEPVPEIQTPPSNGSSPSLPKTVPIKVKSSGVENDFDVEVVPSPKSPPTLFNSPMHNRQKSDVTPVEEAPKTEAPKPVVSRFGKVEEPKVEEPKPEPKKIVTGGGGLGSRMAMFNAPKEETPKPIIRSSTTVVKNTRFSMPEEKTDEKSIQQEADKLLDSQRSEQLEAKAMRDGEKKNAPPPIPAFKPAPKDEEKPNPFKKPVIVKEEPSPVTPPKPSVKFNVKVPEKTDEPVEKKGVKFSPVVEEKPIEKVVVGRQRPSHSVFIKRPDEEGGKTSTGIASKMGALSGINLRPPGMMGMGGPRPQRVGSAPALVSPREESKRSPREAPAVMVSSPRGPRGGNSAANEERVQHKKLDSLKRPTLKGGRRASTAVVNPRMLKKIQEEREKYVGVDVPE